MRHSRTKFLAAKWLIFITASFLIGYCFLGLSDVQAKTCVAGSSGGISVRSVCADEIKPSDYKAKLNNGKAIPPKMAPKRVRKLIRAANKISHTPYKWGGGHGSWKDSGYDCSGSVSFALKGAGILKSPLTSGSLASYGKSGKGKWITIYANSSHVFMMVAGLRFDTSGASPSRWQKNSTNLRGYSVRHPKGM